MKIAIVYYSGTGISAHVANCIGQEFVKYGHSIDFFRGGVGDPQKIVGYDLLGVGAPTYSFYPPRPFLSFLKKIPKQATPFFLFYSCHSIQGYTVYGLYRALKRLGAIYTGEKLRVSGISNIRAWRRGVKRPVPSEKLSGLDKIPSLVERLHTALTAGSPPLGRRREYLNPLWELYALLFTWPWEMASVEGTKRVDTTLCTRCGLCASHICPAGAITLDGESIPQFSYSHCVGCSGCVNLCPDKAIYTKLNRNKQTMTYYSKEILSPPRSL